MNTDPKRCDRCALVGRARVLSDDGYFYVACECGRVGPDARTEPAALRAWNVTVAPRAWRGAAAGDVAH